MSRGICSVTQGRVVPSISLVHRAVSNILVPHSIALIEKYTRVSVVYTTASFFHRSQQLVRSRFASDLVIVCHLYAFILMNCSDTFSMNVFLHTHWRHPEKSSS